MNHNNGMFLLQMFVISMPAAEIRPAGETLHGTHLSGNVTGFHLLDDRAVNDVINDIAGDAGPVQQAPEEIGTNRTRTASAITWSQSSNIVFPPAWLQNKLHLLPPPHKESCVRVYLMTV